VKSYSDLGQAVYGWAGKDLVAITLLLS